MGRLFQYQRFGSHNNSTYTANIEKDNQERRVNSLQKTICSTFSELYVPTDKSKCSELKIKKQFPQRNNKFPSHNFITMDSTKNQNYLAHQTNENEKEYLVEAVKRTKIYNCLREFLKRNFFQQQIQASNLSKPRAKHCRRKTDDDDEITSDYEEIDMLDSSYNADEEDENEQILENCACTATAPSYRRSQLEPNSSTLRTALSFSCWQHRNQSTDATPNNSTDSEADQIIKATYDVSDDAGISDCCQLITNSPTKKLRNISHKSSRKVRKSYGRKQRRFRTANAKDDSDDEDSDDLNELLETSWYQPRITTKAAHERLQQSLPGSFLVRRKARTFELCLRAESKVKQFTVIASSDDTYKLKGAKKQFSSLKALVTHHSVMAEQLPLTLSLPREKQLCTSSLMRRCADDFDTFESLNILGILQTLQTRNFDSS